MDNFFKNIRHDQHLSPINYYAKDFSSDFHMWFHSHNYLEIMYCKTGSIFFEVNKNNTTIISKTLMPGDFIFISENIFHKIKIADDTKSNIKTHIYNVEFSIDDKPDKYFHIDYSYLLKKSPGLAALASSQEGFTIVRDTTGVGNIFLEFVNCLSAEPKNFEDELTMRLLCCQFLTAMGKSRLQTEKIGVVYLKRALEFINANFAKNITTDIIAEVAGVTKSYLQRLFKEHYGINIHEYVCRKRIEYSKTLLKTQTPLKSIAETSGFNNHAHYLYEFKKFCGFTPTEYRRNLPENSIDHNYEYYKSEFIVEKNNY